MKESNAKAKAKIKEKRKRMKRQKETEEDENNETKERRIGNICGKDIYRVDRRERMFGGGEEEK